jgi:hypothetical protein
MTETRVALLVRVPAGLKSRLAEIAERERRSLSKQIELLLEGCLDVQNQQSSTATPSLKGGRRVNARSAKAKKKAKQKEQSPES